jgi:preprotein translocase subunit YajC
VPPYVQLLVILVAVAGFWAIVMRPARNQQRKVANLQQELEIGDEIVLSAGIFGIVRSLTETRAEIEVAPGTIITVARQVVVRRVEDLDEPADRTDAADAPDATGPDATEPTDPTGPTGTED